LVIAALITTAAMIAGSIAMIVTGMIVTGTTDRKMSATATIATNVIVKKGVPTDARGHALLPVAEKMIVVPGRLRLGRILKIKGLQGTIAAAMKRMTGTTKGLPDTMGTAGGVEGGCRVVVVRGPNKNERDGTGD
jgi:hypothetical protein